MSEWIKWYGGECPVLEGTKVDVKHRDGDIFYKVPAGTDEAHDWTNEGFSADIVAYRVAENDNVNTPSHYASGNLECIDAIREMLTKEQFKGMLAGNVLKYLWRRDYKGDALTDLKKCRWYLNRLIEEYENDNGN